MAPLERFLALLTADADADALYRAVGELSREDLKEAARRLLTERDVPSGARVRAAAAFVLDRDIDGSRLLTAFLAVWADLGWLLHRELRSEAERRLDPRLGQEIDDRFEAWRRTPRRAAPVRPPLDPDIDFGWAPSADDITKRTYGAKVPEMGGGHEPAPTEPPRPPAEPAPSPPPRPDRVVSTGFAPDDAPTDPIDPAGSLVPGARYWFWFEVGEPVAGSIETSPRDLPAEHLPPSARLTVALFGFPGEIAVVPGQDIGEVQLRADGEVRVVHRPAAKPVGVSSQRLFFPVRTANREGFQRLRCNVYYGQILVQSRLIEAEVDSFTKALPQGRPRLRSTVDYSLSQRLEPAQLAGLEPHRLSLMLNGDGATHNLRFFGSDGGERFKSEATLDVAKLQDLTERARKALRRVSWGDDEEWAAGKKYRYSGRVDRARLTADLARLAIAGYRLYTTLSRALDDDAPERFDQLMRTPGRVQIALKEEARFVLPAALLYDINWDTNAFPLERATYRLCPAFEAALDAPVPLEEAACFHGACPVRAESDRIRADPNLTLAELGPQICPSGFWGFRHALGLPVSIGGAPDAPAALTFTDAPTLHVGVSADPTFRLRVGHERALQALRSGLGWRRADTRTGVLGMLKQGTPPPQVVYFYCHGGCSESAVPYLDVGWGDGRGWITPDNLTAERVRWSSRPLVFINGCHTTALEPETAFELVTAFVADAWASGVVGTEVTIFEELARDFAEECLRRFVGDGLPLGDAVRNARLALLQKKGNPLGLVYVPFALAGLALAPAAPEATPAPSPPPPAPVGG